MVDQINQEDMGILDQEEQEDPIIDLCIKRPFMVKMENALDGQLLENDSCSNKRLRIELPLSLELPGGDYRL